MSRIGSKNTKPEMLVRRYLFSHGYRYRLNVGKLPGRPDIVLPKYRTAIFVNGCFWHGHSGCRYYTVPKTNVDFWIGKVNRNRERDLEAATQLESLGWNVMTVWECELKKPVFDDSVSRIEAELAVNKAKWEAELSRRKEYRESVRKEASRLKEARSAVEKELQDQFHIPVKIRRMSHKDVD